jgi:hypothetical protein
MNVPPVIVAPSSSVTPPSAAIVPPVLVTAPCRSSTPVVASNSPLLTVTFAPVFTVSVEVTASIVPATSLVSVNAPSPAPIWP